MSGFLLDTNVISELIRPKPEPRVRNWVSSAEDSLIYLSVLTIGEIRKGITAVRDSHRRKTLEAWLDREVVTRFVGRILPIDQDVADRWGRITGALALGAGQKRTIPVIDGLLAATAMHYNLALVTRDVQDVAATGVSVFDPWHD